MKRTALRLSTTCFLIAALGILMVAAGMPLAAFVACWGGSAVVLLVYRRSVRAKIAALAVSREGKTG